MTYDEAGKRKQIHQVMEVTSKVYTRSEQNGKIKAIRFLNNPGGL